MPEHTIKSFVNEKNSRANPFFDKAKNITETFIRKIEHHPVQEIFTLTEAFY